MAAVIKTSFASIKISPTNLTLKLIIQAFLLRKKGCKANLNQCKIILNGQPFMKRVYGSAVHVLN